MAMTAAVPSHAFLAAFLPVVQASIFPATTTQTITRRIPLLHRLRTSVLPAVFLPIPAIVDTIWEGILKAVPKKKTSHMKKRHRFMAGKALKDVTALVKCSSCGRPKKAHVLCPYCVSTIRAWFVEKLGAGEKIKEEQEALVDQLNPQLRLMSKRRIAEMKEQQTAISGQASSEAEELGAFSSRLRKEDQNSLAAEQTKLNAASADLIVDDASRSTSRQDAARSPPL